ncbi:hypothetical protein [Thiolapillus brandeum]|uniref:DUF2489 domain-containing protein n=1 Tax=Thiolapillus brandeum TaxID=1076588 RepID=A0A7U6GKQ0_9GAMM|nr:hypothetical protein [Thiolapillus brandeum]BAO45437.1 hypothetical protein TBH_C2530 [Thiolapillus brandeum]
MGILLTSTVIAAIVAAAVAFWTAQRKISIENITQDRRAWREKIRNNALSVHDALISRDEKSLNKHRAEFAALLNPNDIDDREIIGSIKLPVDGRENEYADEFSERIALLLKHDWERVKLEAGPFFMRIKGVRQLLSKIIYQPNREKYKRAP